MYICHYCLTYNTKNKCDMIKHFNRKTKCECNTLNSYEEAQILSPSKKYIFNINYKKLSINDILFIITNYNDTINYITTNYKKTIKNNKNNEIINEFKNNEVENNEIKNNEIKNNEIKNNEIENNILNNKKSHILDKYFDEIKQKYICIDCSSEFFTRQGLERHFNTNICIKRKKLNELIIKKTEYNNMIQEKQKIKDALQSTFIQNNNNTQNIQNNNNNLSNSHNSTYNVDIKDFVHDKYDLSHIKDDYYLQKDFFLYHNLLKTIMENKNNQNIIFSGNDAIIYTDNELNKMSSDKAGYMVLDKLSQSFDQLFYKNSEETQNYYAFIQKYYHVIKGHYKHDTIYKEYDIDDRRFIYTANSRLFRSRDKYLAKIGTSLSKCKDSARENMMISLDEINNIPTINPNIEDFASIKMRYRDLKDKDY
jgi:hypothetical protein